MADPAPRKINTYIADNNLPVQPTPFIGRGPEVDAACNLLGRGDVRLVTLTGPGGAGKTRLGVQVASLLLDSFADGVFFVHLAAITDPALVPTAIAGALALKEAPDKPLVESLKSHLRHKHTLLLLDNFEQVMSAAPMVADLLSTAPDLKALVTSRERLHLRGEHELSVPPLTMPDLESLPPVEQLESYEAIRLFTERAAALAPGFEVNRDNAPAIAEICARLDGLPLAIELAAVRIKVLSPQGILARLQNRLRLLTGGERDLPTRQQTLHNAIAWSYDMLDQGEMILFRRLSVFAGSRSIEAIEAICNSQNDLPIDSLDGVTSLVDKHLLQTSPAGGTGSDTRFTMLETIQEFTRQKLEESGEVEVMRQAHANWFAAMAEQAESALKGPNQTEWLAKLDQEHDNLRAALRWTLDANRVEMALNMGAALMQFWRMRGHLSEGRSWLSQALSILDFGGPEGTPILDPTEEQSKLESPEEQSKIGVPSGPPKSKIERACARALMAEGILASAQRDFTHSMAALRRSLDLFRQVGDKANAVSALRSLGNDARFHGDYDTAQSSLAEGLVLAREIGDQWNVAKILSDLGIVAQIKDDNKAARSLYGESLAINRQLGDERGVAMALVNLGELARTEAEYDAARTLYMEALGLARNLGDRLGVGMVLHNLGHVAYHQGEHDSALALFSESLEIFYALKTKWDCVYCLAALAGLYGAQGRLRRAAVLFSATEALMSTTSSHLDPADRLEYERNQATTRAQLSNADWQRAWAKGQAMTLDEAVAYALAEEPEPVPAPAPSKAITTPLDRFTTGTLKERLPAHLTDKDFTTGPLNGRMTGPLGDYPFGLTQREMDVLQQAAGGLGDAQIGVNLSISTRTVQRHLSAVYEKLGVTSRTAAVRIALEQGLIPPAG